MVRYLVHLVLKIGKYLGITNNPYKVHSIILFLLTTTYFFLSEMYILKVVEGAIPKIIRICGDLSLFAFLFNIFVISMFFKKESWLNFETLLGEIIPKRNYKKKWDLLIFSIFLLTFVLVTIFLYYSWYRDADIKRFIWNFLPWIIQEFFYMFFKLQLFAILRLFLQEYKTVHFNNMEKSCLKLKKLSEVFNDLFGFPFLMCLFHDVQLALALILEVGESNQLNKDLISTCLSLAYYNITSFTVIVMCDVVTAEAEKMRNFIEVLFFKKGTNKHKICQILDYIQINKPDFSAGGFVSLRKVLILKELSALVSFAILAIQLDTIKSVADTV